MYVLHYSTQCICFTKHIQISLKTALYVTSMMEVSRWLLISALSLFYNGCTSTFFHLLDIISVSHIFSIWSLNTLNMFSITTQHLCCIWVSLSCFVLQFHDLSSSKVLLDLVGLNNCFSVLEISWLFILGFFIVK